MILSPCLSRKSCTKRELLSLIGSLQCASAVIKPGQVFLRRLIDLSKRQVHLDAPMRLNAEGRGDLRWWATFIDRWNGVSIVSALTSRCLADPRCFLVMGVWCLLSPVLVQHFMGSVPFMDGCSYSGKGAVTYCLLCYLGTANDRLSYPLSL